MRALPKEPLVKRIWVNAGLTLLFTASRALCLSPFFIPWPEQIPLDFFYATLVRIAVSALLFLFVAWPERLFRLRAVKALEGGQQCKFHYFQAVARALLRLARVSAALLPALLLSGVWYYIYLYNAVGFNQTLKLLKKIGAVFGGTYDLGVALLWGALLISLLVLAVLWNADKALDYVENGKKALRIKKRARRERFKLSVSNFLLCLPALALVCVVLLPVFLNNLKFGQGFMSLSFSAISAFKAPLSTETIAYLLLIFFGVYLSTFAFRKARCGRMYARLEAHNET